MDPKRSVLVQVDPEENYVNKGVTGRFTETHQRALYPLIRRARTFVPGMGVRADLTNVEPADATGLALLNLASNPGTSGNQGGQVAFLHPDPLPRPQHLFGPDAPTKTPLSRGFPRRSAA
jgi:hypothetical protein